MGMPLRITFRDIDYRFQVINKEPVTKNTVEIPIIFEDQTIWLVKGSKGWKLKEEIANVDEGLIQAIGRAIELRFRL